MKWLQRYVFRSSQFDFAPNFYQFFSGYALDSQTMRGLIVEVAKEVGE